MTTHDLPRFLLCAALAGLAAGAAAQTHPPLTAAPDDGAVGAVTRGLLAAQADGRRAGPGLPLQGPVASAAWQRYLESFSQPIPQWFGERIEDNVGGSGGGGG